jgi:hypothetical protein
VCSKPCSTRSRRIAASPKGDYGPGRFGQPGQAGERRGDGATRQPADGTAGARAGIGRGGSAGGARGAEPGHPGQADALEAPRDARDLELATSGSTSPGSNVGPSPSAVVWSPSGWSSRPLRSPVEPSRAEDELTPDSDRRPGRRAQGCATACARRSRCLCERFDALGPAPRAEPSGHKPWNSLNSLGFPWRASAAGG